MDRGAWWATVRGVAKSQTGLSTYTHTQKITRVLLFVFPLTLVLDPNITTQSGNTALPLN